MKTSTPHYVRNLFQCAVLCKSPPPPPPHGVRTYVRTYVLHIAGRYVPRLKVNTSYSCSAALRIIEPK